MHTTAAQVLVAAGMLPVQLLVNGATDKSSPAEDGTLANGQNRVCDLGALCVASGMHSPLHVTDLFCVDSLDPHVLGQFGKLSACQSYTVHAGVEAHVVVLVGLEHGLAVPAWQSRGTPLLLAKQVASVCRVYVGFSAPWQPSRQNTNT